MDLLLAIAVGGGYVYWAWRNDYGTEGGVSRVSTSGGAVEPLGAYAACFDRRAVTPATPTAAATRRGSST